MASDTGMSGHGFVDEAGIDLLVRQGVWRLQAGEASILVRVLRKFGIRFFVVFGSVATDRASSQSDIDLGYFTAPKRRVNPLKLFADLNRALLSDRLDLVSLNRATPLLARDVARDGRLIWAEDPSEWTDFRQRAWKEWDDVQRLEDYRLRAAKRWLAQWKLNG